MLEVLSFIFLITFFGMILTTFGVALWFVIRIGTFIFEQFRSTPLHKS